MRRSKGQTIGEVIKELAKNFTDITSSLMKPVSCACGIN